ncbi:MAG: cbb3-type cytochrome c oxidase subunit I [Chthoniobacteraceae bacterium]
MSDTLTQTPISASPSVSDSEIHKVERALIDQSAQTPLLFLYSSAILWLLVATVFGLIASIKLQYPEFLGSLPVLGSVPFFTYGRIWPAFTNAFAYGWASQVGMGTGIWLVARLAHVSIKRPTLLIFGTVFWNIGVSLGVVAILAGAGRGIDLLEFPGFVQGILFVGFLLIAAWVAVMLRLRRPGHTYISLWYLAGAFFWFAWLYSAGNLMVGSKHSPGILQAIVASWYASNFISLWLTSIGLGAIYYFIPKVSGKPVHSYHLASLGFWSFALFSGWTGMTRLIGGPLPAWLITVSIVASIMMIIPVVTVTLNFVLTLRGDYHLIYFSPTIRFVFFGAIAYAAGSGISVIGSLRSVAGITQFTNFSVANSQLMIYSFFSMVMFGSIYYIIPRLVGCEWLSSRMIGVHFLGAAYGGGIIVVATLVSGLLQGSGWNNPGMSSSVVVESMLPLTIGRIIGWGFLIFAHFVFALHFLTMLLRLGRPSGRPTLFAGHHEEVSR